MARGDGKSREASGADSTNWGTRQELADRLGISRRRVGQLIAEGKIVQTPLGIDLDKAVGEYQRKTDHSKSRANRPHNLRVVAAANSPADDAADGQGRFRYDESRAAKEHYNAENARLRFLRDAGELIARDEVERREFAIARVIRDRLLGLPSRLADIVPAEGVQTIEHEVKALLREMQDEVRKITKMQD